MKDEQLSWLIQNQDYLYQNEGRDLYDIIYSTLSNDKMSYISFVKMASEGSVFFPSEGTGYSLDEDWDDPSEFVEVIFFLGEYESSTITPQHFIKLMQVISDSYVEAYPEDKETVEHYMLRLRERYS